ncbi:hypothetical protein ACOCEA_04460 [Maribacter sp. CXY002]|uniref:hypothetical protein n=1 Tax=Maribacter luteocoastalis TaxID=3407671 RepID=UPI003B66C2E6
MAKFFKINFVIFLTIVFGCKGPSKNIEPALQDKLAISFDAIFYADDELQLYYKTKEGIYTEEKSIKLQLEGSDSFQKIQFVLDQLIFPQNIRIDLGKNKEQKIIRIENFRFNYNNQKHVLTDQEFKKYFVPNKYIKANFNNLTFTPLVIDKLYDPYLSSYDISYFVNKLILY